jgi:uncharacterized repeat protein (TIGR03803 family)
MRFMRSANSARHLLQTILSLSLISALGACDLDFGSGSGSRHPSSGPALTYAVGGTVSGLATGAALTLLDNYATPLRIAANGVFIFGTSLAAGARYLVTVGTQPMGQTCKVAGGSGTAGTDNAANVLVTCTNQAYTVGGMIRGLTSGGLVLSNANADLSVPSGAQSFTLPSTITVGTRYNLTVKTQPTYLNCVISAGSGIVPAHAVTGITVTCTAKLFTLSGTIAGLGAQTGLVLRNGADTLNVPANAAAFVMPTGIANGVHYDLTIESHPPAESCSILNGSGSLPGADVTNIAVTCTMGTESVLYSFAGAPGDGAEPWYGHLILASDGNLYGMTPFGGTQDLGTIFKVTPAGVETVLWSFGSSGDGANPYGSLIQGRDGNFYGMTTNGGLHGAGIVFKITPAGAETVLWSFGNANDGYNSYGSLIQARDGNFYGMTYQGGLYGVGTIFKITPAGVETVIWSFGNGSDGAMPYGQLVQGADASFYGMTYAGGTLGLGTIFKVTPAGAETVLWSLGATGDGAHPTGSLILATDGDLYGMTIEGGANSAGAVVKIVPGGTESVLYSFGNNSGDGFEAQGSLVQGPDGNFYGTNDFGGGTGRGTIIQITPSGTETVLYSFGLMPDGAGAYGGLTLGADGTLYGMTVGGGVNNLGAVFTFK